MDMAVTDDFGVVVLELLQVFGRRLQPTGNMCRKTKPGTKRPYWATPTAMTAKARVVPVVAGTPPQVHPNIYKGLLIHLYNAPRRSRPQTHISTKN